jgi:cytidylate kinase
VARRLAARFGYRYVDSGALYRGIAWKTLENRGDAAKPADVLATLGAMRVEFFEADGAVRCRIDGHEPRAEIRTERVSGAVSAVAAMPEVRTAVTQWLRDMVRFGNLVMEGRDIGTVVFPAADRKFYLDASPEERARRRHAELQPAGEAKDVKGVMSSLQSRDRKDSGRAAAPLRVAADAIVIDTTGLTIDQVVEEIVAKAG